MCLYAHRTTQHCWHDTLALSSLLLFQVWRLAWNLISYKDIAKALSFEKQSIYSLGLRQLAHAAKYLVKLHPISNTLYASVGDVNFENAISNESFLVPEQYLGANVSRPVIEINATTGGADLIGEACAAFASLGILLKDEDTASANSMTLHARQLYDWMDLVPGSNYSHVHSQLQETYPSQV